VGTSTQRRFVDTSPPNASSWADPSTWTAAGAAAAGGTGNSGGSGGGSGEGVYGGGSTAAVSAAVQGSRGAAGLDLLLHTPEAVEWALALAAGLALDASAAAAASGSSGSEADAGPCAGLVLGRYATAGDDDGSAKLAVAMDAVVAAVLDAVAGA